MQVQLSYEEKIINAFYQNPQKRGEHFISHGHRLHKILRGILQPLYDELDQLRNGANSDSARTKPVGASGREAR